MHVGILSEQLRARGHQVTALCSAGSKIEKDMTKRQIPVVHFAPAGYFDPVTLWRTRSFLKRQAVDLIHAHYSRDLWTLAPLSAMSGKIPIVFIKHIGTQKPKRDPFHRWIYGHIRHTIAISQVIAHNLAATHPIDPERISVIHHGLDLSLYNSLEEKRQQARVELDIKPDEILIGTVGRLQEGKGHLEFLEMAKSISVEFPNSRFIIVGEPTKGEEHRANAIYHKISQIGLGHRLILAGFRKDIPSALAAMDIFAFPSHAEAFGLVLIEAMAAGLPVISSRCDGVLDIVKDGETGILVEPKSAAQLAKAVRTLLLDASLRHRLSRAGRQDVERRFSIERMVNEVENIYAQCVSADRIQAN